MKLSCKNSNNVKVRKQGFSLVEVLLAIVILSIIAAPILSAFFTSLKTNLLSKELMAATDCSQTIIEEIEKGTLTEVQLKLEKNSTDLEETPYRFESLNIKKADVLSKKLEAYESIEEFKRACNRLKCDAQYIYYSYSMDEDDNIHYYYFINNVGYSQYDSGKYRYYYDVIIDITPVDVYETGDDYYALLVNVDMYSAGQEDKRFDDYQCGMNGSIMNSY